MASTIRDVRIDVELLKKDVDNITALCTKMDGVIDRLLTQQESYFSQIYQDMNDKERDVNGDIKELHSRITTTTRELADKIELTERRLMEELAKLRQQILEHNLKEDSNIEKLFGWKWMIVGGVVALSWLISNIDLEVLSKLVK